MPFNPFENNQGSENGFNPFDQNTTPAPNQNNDSVFSAAADGFLANTGGMIADASKAISNLAKPSYMSDDEWNEKLPQLYKSVQKFGENLQTEHQKEYEPYSKDWWAYNAAGILPSAGGLAIGSGVALRSANPQAVGTAAYNFATKMGAGPKLAQFAGEIAPAATVGTAASLPEASIEGQNAYDEAIKDGHTEQEAQKIRNSVTLANTLLLTGANTAEIAAVFAKLPFKVPDNIYARVLANAGKVTALAGPEAIEEGTQQIIQDKAANKPIDWEATKQSAAVGAVGGLMFGGAGKLANNYLDRKRAARGSSYNPFEEQQSETMDTTGQGLNDSNSLGNPDLTQSFSEHPAVAQAGEYAPLIMDASKKYNVPAPLIASVIKHESSFDKDAQSGAGAVGLMQLMPDTAAELGVQNRNDPAESIDGGTRYLRQLLDTFGGDVEKAVAAYNAGPQAVKDSGGVPPYAETRNYVSKVMGDYNSGPVGYPTDIKLLEVDLPVAQDVEDYNGVKDSIKRGARQMGAWLQDTFGITPTITSGRRSEENNTSVNGAKNSWHLSGDAVDLDVGDLTPEQKEQIKQMAEQLGFKEVLYHDAGSGLHLHLANLDESRAAQEGSYSAGGSLAPIHYGDVLSIASDHLQDPKLTEDDRRHILNMMESGDIDGIAKSMVDKNGESLFEQLQKKGNDQKWNDHHQTMADLITDIQTQADKKKVSKGLETKPFMPDDYYNDPEKLKQRQSLLDTLNSVNANKFDDASHQAKQMQADKVNVQQRLVDALNSINTGKFDQVSHEYIAKNYEKLGDMDKLIADSLQYHNVSPDSVLNELGKEKENLIQRQANYLMMMASNVKGERYPVRNEQGDIVGTRTSNLQYDWADQYAKMFTKGNGQPKQYWSQLNKAEKLEAARMAAEDQLRKGHVDANYGETVNPDDVAHFNALEDGIHAIGQAKGKGIEKALPTGLQAPQPGSANNPVSLQDAASFVRSIGKQYRDAAAEGVEKELESPLKMTREEFNQISGTDAGKANGVLSPIETQKERLAGKYDRYLLGDENPVLSRIKEDAYGVGGKYEVKEPEGHNITVYRAVPNDVNSILPGQFVTASKKYAQDHLDRHTSGYLIENPKLAKGGKIIELSVPKNDLYLAAANELIWAPKDAYEAYHEAYQNNSQIEFKQQKTGTSRSFSFEGKEGKTISIPVGDDAEKIRILPSANWNAQEKAIADLGRFMGNPVQVFIGRKELRGFHDPGSGVTFVNRNGNRGVEWAFWHETLHWMKGHDKALYEDLLYHVQESSEIKPEQVDAYRNTIALGNELSHADIIEEMLSDEFADNAKRHAWLQQLQKSDASLLQRVAEWIQKVVAQIKYRVQVGENSHLSLDQIDAFEQQARKTLLSLHDDSGRRLFSDRTDSTQAQSGTMAEPATRYSSAADKEKSRSLQSSGLQLPTEEVNDSYKFTARHHDGEAVLQHTSESGSGITKSSVQQDISDVNKVKLSMGIDETKDNSIRIKSNVADAPKTKAMIDSLTRIGWVKSSDSQGNVVISPPKSSLNSNSHKEYMVNYKYRKPTEKKESAAGDNSLPRAQKLSGNVKGEYTDTVITKRQMLNRLNEIFTTIRSGRIGKKGIDGFINHDSGVIRLRSYGDINTLSHEIGHLVDAALGLRSDSGTFDSEFSKAVDTRFGKGAYPSNKIRSEGIAEFFHDYVTDAAKAKKEFPSYYDSFEVALKKNSDVYARVNEFREMVRVWHEQSPEAMGRSAVTYPYENKESFFKRGQKAWQDFKEKMIDDKSGLDKFASDYEKLTGEKLVTENNPYKMARLAQGSAVARAEMLAEGKNPAMVQKILNQIYGGSIKHAVTLKSIFDSVNEKELSKAYPDYLKKGNYKNWFQALDSLLVARRQAELQGIHENYKGPIPTDKAEAIIKNAPQQLQDAAHKVYQFNDNMLRILTHEGMVKPEVYHGLSNKYKNYVPMSRDFSDEAALVKGMGVGQGFGNVRNALMSIGEHGSTRPVISPLESMVKNTYVMLNLVERNRVGKIFSKLAEGSGIGKLVEEVSGTASSKDSTFSVWVNGQKKTYQTTPEIYRAIMSMNQDSSNFIVNLLSRPASWLRAGATLTPDFAIKNIMRDTFSALVFTRNGFVPVYDHFRALAHMMKNDELYNEYKASGALQSTLTGLDRNYSYDSMQKLIYGSMKEKVNPITYLRAFSEMLETATRLGEYGRARDNGRSLADAALAARDITLDFSKRGAYGKNMNRITAFFNAAIQEPVRLAQAFKEDKYGTSARIVLYIVIPSLVLWSYIRSDPEKSKEYDEFLAYEKDLFWNIPVNKDISATGWLRIPKPFGLGVLFGSGTERMLDWMKRKDPKSVEAWAKTTLGAFLPSIIPTAAAPLLQWVTNYSFFAERNIVPQKQINLPDSMQFGPNTSGVAKVLGSALDLSPRKLDMLMQGYGGGMASQVLNGIDAVKGDKPYINPFQKAFTVDPSKSPQSMQDYYDALQESKGKYEASKITSPNGKAVLKGVDRYNYQVLMQANEMMSKLNKRENILLSKTGSSELELKHVNEMQLNLAQRTLKRLKQ